MPPHEKSPFRLHVEGKDDARSINNLMKKNSFDPDSSTSEPIYIQATEGIEKMLNQAAIGAALKTYRRVGWVVDADLEPKNRWKQFCGAFARHGLILPNEPLPEGTIIDGILPEYRVGVWMMPNNGSPGILEDFIARLVPSDDKCWPHAKISTETASALGAPLKNKDRSKGEIHTWLAWQENPGVGLGSAINNQVLRSNCPESSLFVTWFKKLFS